MQKRPRRPRSKKQPLTPEQLGAQFEQLYGDYQELWSVELLEMDTASWKQLTSVHLQLCRLEELARMSGMDL